MPLIADQPTKSDRARAERAGGIAVIAEASAQQSAEEASYPANALLYQDTAEFIAESTDGDYGIIDGSVWFNNAGVAEWVSDNVTRTSSLTGLRAFNGLGPNSRALVTGHSAPGDGGGGTWYYDATSTDDDDDVTTIKPDSIDSEDPGRWKRDEEQILMNLKPQMTGLGNTSAAINKLVEVITNTTNAGRILIPSGTYSITEPIEITADFLGVFFEGEGMANTVFQSDANIDAFIVFGAGRLEPETTNRGQVKGIRFEEGTGTHVHCVRTEDAANVEIERNWFVSGEFGIYLHDGGNNIVQYNRFSGQTDRTIRMRNESGSKIAFNLFQNVRFRGLEIVHGSFRNKIIYNDFFAEDEVLLREDNLWGITVADDTGTIDDGSIDNVLQYNYFEGFDRSVVVSGESLRTSISNNTSNEAVEIGFIVQGEAQHTDLVNNTAINSGIDSFRIDNHVGDGVRDTTLKFNKSINSSGQDFAIREAGSSGTVLMMNQFSNILNNVGDPIEYVSESNIYTDSLELLSTGGVTNLDFLDDTGSVSYRINNDPSSNQLNFVRGGVGAVITFDEDGNATFTQNLTVNGEIFGDVDEAEINIRSTVLDAVSLEVEEMTIRWPAPASAIQAYLVLEVYRSSQGGGSTTIDGYIRKEFSVRFASDGTITGIPSEQIFSVGNLGASGRYFIGDVIQDIDGIAIPIQYESSEPRPVRFRLTAYGPDGAINHFIDNVETTAPVAFGGTTPGHTNTKATHTTFKNGLSSNITATDPEDIPTLNQVVGMDDDLSDQIQVDAVDGLVGPYTTINDALADFEARIIALEP